MYDRLKNLLLAAIASGTLATGCSSIDQITTPPPVPGVRQPADVSPAQSPFSVVIETGESTPPAEVASLRFRIAEVWVRPVDGEWQRRRAQTGSIRLTHDEPVSRTVLSGSIPPGNYDRIALLVENVRAEYQGNAGGPLAAPEGTPVEIDLSFTASRNQSVILSLMLDSNASVWQDTQGRWHFTPILVPDVVETTAAEAS